MLIDNRFEEDYAEEPPILYDLPPLVIGIPEDEYIVDLGEAEYDDIRQVLLAPPVQELERPYTLDEVLRNEQVRAYVPAHRSRYHHLPDRQRDNRRRSDAGAVRARPGA